MRFRSDVVAALALSGCAFSDGDPWATAQLSLTLALQPEADRLEGELIKTDEDYRVRIEVIELDVDEVALEGGEAEAADSGHSHDHGHEAEEEEHEEVGELAVATGGHLSLALGDATQATLVCADDCAITSVAVLEHAHVVLGAVRVRGVVFDARTGDGKRLGDEGKAFDVTVGSASYEGEVGQAVGPGEPIGVRVALSLDVGALSFDGIDFAASDETIASGVAEAWNQLTLSVTTTRFE